MLKRQDALDAEAEVFCAQMDIALRASILDVGGDVEVEDAAQAEMVQDAVQDADEEDEEARTRASLATIQDQLAADAAEGLRRAAVKDAEDSAAQAVVATLRDRDDAPDCGICCEVIEVTQMPCCQYKVCWACYKRCCTDKCPYCRQQQ